MAIVSNSTPLLDLIYPIGSLYLSTNSTNPATLFGGTWEQITGYYLYAGTGGNTSGSNTSGSTVLTAKQSGIPKHSHEASYSGADFYVRHGNTSGTATVKGGNNTSVDTGVGETWSNGFETSNYSHQIDKVNIGGSVSVSQNDGANAEEGHTHTIEPLRYEVYMWKRTT